MAAVAAVAGGIWAGAAIELCLVGRFAGCGFCISWNAAWWRLASRYGGRGFHVSEASGFNGRARLVRRAGGGAALAKNALGERAAMRGSMLFLSFAVQERGSFAVVSAALSCAGDGRDSGWIAEGARRLEGADGNCGTADSANSGSVASNGTHSLRSVACVVSGGERA